MGCDAPFFGEGSKIKKVDDPSLEIMLHMTLLSNKQHSLQHQKQTA